VIACIEGQNGLDGDERGGGVDSLEHSLGPMLALLALGSEELPGSSEFAASQY